MAINMIRALVAPALLFAMLASAASAQERPSIYLKAEECLRSNVDRVVTDEPNMQSAADFLITYVCADQVYRVTKYELNQTYVRMFSSMATAIPQVSPGPGKPPPISLKFDAKVDPETGDIIVPPEKPGDPPNPMANLLRMQMGTAVLQFSQVMPVELRKLAGELVLATRERQLAKAH